MPQPSLSNCDIRASFAFAFKSWRIRKKIPLKRIAADLGLTVATISLWESGKRFPTGHHFEILADYTGEPPCRLLCKMADQCMPAACQLAQRKKP
jgi:transcriptional regulator with XRE-family HTH domain